MFMKMKSEENEKIEIPIYINILARAGERSYETEKLELFFLHFNLIGWILLLKILKPKEKIYFKWVCRLSSKWNNNNNKNIAVMLTNRPNRPDSLKRLGMLWLVCSKNFTIWNTSRHCCLACTIWMRMCFRLCQWIWQQYRIFIQYSLEIIWSIR